MPCLTLNLDALEHNTRLARDVCQSWGVSFLPVLKMVACHPVVCETLREAGYSAIGAADIDELRMALPGAEIVDFSGNYTILDVTDCPDRLVVGSTVIFYPSYWAVAKAYRTPTVAKQYIRAAARHGSALCAR